jgi:PAS domain-containing protein
MQIDAPLGEVANHLTQQTLDALPGLWWKLLYCANHQQDGGCLGSPLESAYLDGFEKILRTPLAELSRDAEENGAARLLRSGAPEQLILESVTRPHQVHFKFVYASVREILRNLESESANGASEHLLLASSHASTIACSLRDGQRRLMGLNAVAQAMLNASGGDYVGKTSRELMGTVAEQVEAVISEAIATGRVAPVSLAGQLSRRNQHGEWRAEYLPVRGTDKRIQAIKAVVVEVTVEREMENRLAALARQPGLSDETKMWNRELRRTLTVFNLFLDEVVVSIAGTRGTLDQFRHQLMALDQRVLALKNLLSAQAGWLAGLTSTMGSTNLN